MTMSATMTYGVAQEHDWNALSHDEFRAIVREELQTHYPHDQRFPPRRLRWHENRNWYLRMAAKGWIAPAWPREYGGMGLSPAKLLIFIEEQERCGVMRFQDHGIQMVGPVLMKYGTENRSGATCHRSCRASTSGARATRNPIPVQTWPACRPARCSMATSS